MINIGLFYLVSCLIIQITFLVGFYFINYCSRRDSSLVRGALLRLHKLSFVYVLIENQGEFELLGDFIDRALSVVLQVGRRENRVKYHPKYVNKL
jgi:hypothetical protein